MEIRDRLTGLAMIGALVFFLGPPPPHATTLARGCTTTVPASLSHLNDSQQVIVATSPSWTSTKATLRAYELRNGVWCKARGPVSARLGYSGFAWEKDRRQNTGKTPAGTFALPWAFGNAADPGTDLRYRSVDGNDWWAYDPKRPASYNRWLEHGLGDVRAGWAEHLRSYGAQYAYSVIIDYNDPSLPGQAARPTTTKGGGIFLHVSGKGATAGCVSVARTDMRWILRWLDPGLDPVIVMAPKAAITRA